MKRLAVVAVLMLGSPSMAGAGFKDGNDLLSECESVYLSCMMYVAGAYDAMKVFGEMNSTHKLCMAEGVKLGQLTDIVIKKLKENPEERHWPAPGIIWNIIRETFPCPS